MTWKPIASAFTDPKVTDEQQTLFVMRFGQEACPSFNTVYLHADYPDRIIKLPWRFAEGGGGCHRDWPTHWMFASEAAAMPTSEQR